MRRAIVVAGMAATLACSVVPKEQLKAKEAEAAKYKQATEDVNGKLAESEAKVTSLEQQNAKLQSHTADLEGKLGEATAATAALQEKTPLMLKDQVLFKENSSKLTSEAKRTLDSMADAIGKETGKAIIVLGYTDGTEAAGKDPGTKRWQLSSARALEVAKYFASRGIDPMLIGVAGFGPARPIAPNDSLANRSLNRRVEIMLAPPQNMGTIEVKPAELTPKK